MICVGPMSQEVIEAVFQCAQQYPNTDLALIASKNQIDYNVGYVNNWNTKQYMNFVREMKKKYPNSGVKVCRDHCGPGFNGIKSIDDVYNTIQTDIEQGFDLIHIDFCHSDGDVLGESKRAIEFARGLKPDIEFEIGTDEIGKPFDLDDFYKNFNEFKSICQPAYYVVNTGSLVKADINIGGFDKDVVQYAHDYLNENNVQLKEHNADYLSPDKIALRKDCVNAINIAPELGVNQTRQVLFMCVNLNIDTSAFLNVCYNSKKWEKWMHPGLYISDNLKAILAGHYNFTSEEYMRLIEQLNAHTNVYNELVNAAKVIIRRYAWL